MPDLRDALRALDAEFAFGQIQTFDDILSGATGPRRLETTLLGLFAATASVLALIGIYAVASYNVLQRVREIGVRLALGAGRQEIVSLILRQNLRAVFVGIAVGGAVAFIASRVLASHVFGISALDPLTYLFVGFVFVCTALIACGVPAFRATRIEPVAALRSE
jgi:ABC-type antimicrobial peptide transport system permease subunit